MLDVVFPIIIIATAFPMGYLLAWLTREELADGRKYFNIISWACIFGIFLVLLLIEYQKFVIIWSLMYIAIVTLVCELKSRDRKFVRKK